MDFILDHHVVRTALWHAQATRAILAVELVKASTRMSAETIRFTARWGFDPSESSLGLLHSRS